MATIALPRPIAPHSSSAELPLSPVLSLDIINTSAACPTPIPNKHIPICPPGSAPPEKPDTPPASPPTKNHELSPPSILYPPNDFDTIHSPAGILYRIAPHGVAAALQHQSSQPLPEPSQVFPWLHGLHVDNHIQQAFFIARRRSLRKTPRCWRGIALVKAGGDLSRARLKGAIAPDEFLHRSPDPRFRDLDPREGFSVRNFQIQAAKTAMISDIIVYGDDEAEVRSLAIDVATAQQSMRGLHSKSAHDLPHYNTFMCVGPFEEFETSHPEIVSINAKSRLTGTVMDFFHQERVEMSEMTSASEIIKNVWLGPTPDPKIDPTFLEHGEETWDILIECSDAARLDPSSLERLVRQKETPQRTFLDFPSSGSVMPPSWSMDEADRIVESCKWIHHLANGTHPTLSPTANDLDPDMGLATDCPQWQRPRKILLHCPDGYTETSMLALSLYIYAAGVTVGQAWLQMHVELRRNFFAYPSDVVLLNSICPRLLAASPKMKDVSQDEIAGMINDEPRWLAGMDGSLPSRVTDYMYLGNLTHANNPHLLRAMGIGQLLSVGETASWKDGDLDTWGEDNVCVVKNVQDNGVDPLQGELERCLSFIDRGRQKGVATLVHCRVGVSRSATICIAEVMRTRNLSFPRAYCFTRARRLNVIIQPHLRFSYELLKWEEHLSRQRYGFCKRELEWPEIAREIAAMNRPYAR